MDQLIRGKMKGLLKLTQEDNLFLKLIDSDMDQGEKKNQLGKNKHSASVTLNFQKEI